MSLSETVLLKIKEEIATDPENRGYAGKTDLEIMNLLNNPYTVNVIIQELRPARINKILSGISQTPNIVDSTDVNEAKKL